MIVQITIPLKNEMESVYAFKVEKENATEERIKTYFNDLLAQIKKDKRICL